MGFLKKIMTTNYFITATDTSAGKTYIATKLIKHFIAQNCRVAGFKPLASGCDITSVGLRNDDALQLQSAANINLSYETINPLAFRPAIAPHIAAQKANVTLSVESIHQAMQPALNLSYDIGVVEGAGGWLLPLNETETLADWVVAENFQVVLVVPIRLGCLNHALLTYQSILNSSASFTGWIANCLEPDLPFVDENIQTLKQWIKAPCLGVVANETSLLSI